jgi:hypothetical protein
MKGLARTHNLYLTDILLGVEFDESALLLPVVQRFDKDCNNNEDADGVAFHPVDGWRNARPMVDTKGLV